GECWHFCPGHSVGNHTIQVGLCVPGCESATGQVGSTSSAGRAQSMTTRARHPELQPARFNGCRVPGGRILHPGFAFMNKAKPPAQRKNSEYFEMHPGSLRAPYGYVNFG